MVVVDPRRSETAQKADQYLSIVPGTDVLFLLALLHEIFLLDRDKIGKSGFYLKRMDLIKEVASGFSPAKVAALVGIAEEQIKQLALDFSNAKSAVCYGRMGVSVQKFGTVCQWLINALNIVTGNFDNPGGHMFTTPAVKVRKGSKASLPPKWTSRVSGHPEIIGELPVAVLAEEMTTTGPGQIKAFVCSAGNPVLSTPNGEGLDKALAGLEFMVSIDIYLNETSRHADIILPPATGLEVDHFDLIFNALAVRNTAKYSPALFKPEHGMRYDWQIFKALTKRLDKSKKSLWQSMMFYWQTPTRLLNIALKTGPYGKWKNGKWNIGGLSLNKLKKYPQGIDFGPLKSVMPKNLLTANKKIDLAPQEFVSEISSVNKHFFGGNYKRIALILISRRQLRSNNSWMHNSERLVKGDDRCTVQVNPLDAQSIGLKHGNIVEVRSEQGAIQLKLEATDEMMPGVVSIPHGWGHGRAGTRQSVANQNAGSSINTLTSNKLLDGLSGNAALSGVPVSLHAVDDS